MDKFLLLTHFIRYVPDAWRARDSIKFMLNLSIELATSSLWYYLQTGYSMSSLFTLMSAIATLIVVAANSTQQQSDQRIDYAPAK